MVKYIEKTPDKKRTVDEKITPTPSGGGTLPTDTSQLKAKNPANENGNFQNQINESNKILTDQHTSDIAVLKTDNTTNKGDITALKTDNTQIKSDVLQNTGNINNHETEIKENTKNINANVTAITELEKKVNTNTETTSVFDIPDDPTTIKDGEALRWRKSDQNFVPLPVGGGGSGGTTLDITITDKTKEGDFDNQAEFNEDAVNKQYRQFRHVRKNDDGTYSAVQRISKQNWEVDFTPIDTRGLDPFKYPMLLKIVLDLTKEKIEDIQPKLGQFLEFGTPVESGNPPVGTYAGFLGIKVTNDYGDVGQQVTQIKKGQLPNEITLTDIPLTYSDTMTNGENDYIEIEVYGIRDKDVSCKINHVGDTQGQTLFESPFDLNWNIQSVTRAMVNSIEKKIDDNIANSEEITNTITHKRYQPFRWVELTDPTVSAISGLTNVFRFINKKTFRSVELERGGIVNVAEIRNEPFKFAVMELPVKSENLSDDVLELVTGQEIIVRLPIDHKASDPIFYTEISLFLLNSAGTIVYGASNPILPNTYKSEPYVLTTYPNDKNSPDQALLVIKMLKDFSFKNTDGTLNGAVLMICMKSANELNASSYTKIINNKNTPIQIFKKSIPQEYTSRSDVSQSLAKTTTNNNSIYLHNLIFNGSTKTFNLDAGNIPPNSIFKIPVDLANGSIAELTETPDADLFDDKYKIATVSLTGLTGDIKSDRIGVSVGMLVTDTAGLCNGNFGINVTKNGSGDKQTETTISLNNNLPEMVTASQNIQFGGKFQPSDTLEIAIHVKMERATTVKLINNINYPAHIYRY